MDNLIERIKLVTEEASKTSRASDKVSETSNQIAAHLMMIHHNPEENRTSNHWAGEVSAHLKTCLRHSDKLTQGKILDSLLSCGVTSPYAYHSMHAKMSIDKKDVKFSPPSQERHRKVLDDIHRFAKDLSDGNLPKVINEENS